MCWSRDDATGVQATGELQGTQVEVMLGFNSWADYELRPLAEAAQDGKSAARLLQDCWKQLQPCLARSLQEMKRAGGDSQHSEAYHWMLQSRGTDRFKLAEFLPAEQALERLMEVLGRSCNVTFRPLPSRSWLQTGPPHRRPRVRALDCEMVGVGPRGKRSVLIRVSVVLLDCLTEPEEDGGPAFWVPMRWLLGAKKLAFKFNYFASSDPHHATLFGI
eukprot:s2511_g1.t1